MGVSFAWEDREDVILRDEKDVKKWNLVIKAKMAANKKMWQAVHNCQGRVW
jgi:hypothetical protein